MNENDQLEWHMFVLHDMCHAIKDVGIRQFMHDLKTFCPEEYEQIKEHFDKRQENVRKVGALLAGPV
jgi:hypothetical protein